MTIEEAIQHCEEVATGETEQGKFPECSAEHNQLAWWLKELLALRAQQTPLDRSRWEGCEFCLETLKRYPWVTAESILERSMMFKTPNYCPFCGKPLKEEYWVGLERRINGG